MVLPLICGVKTCLLHGSTSVTWERYIKKGKTYCELLLGGLVQNNLFSGWGVGYAGGVCVRSLTANLREHKSLYLFAPESTMGLRTGRRWAA